MANGLIQRKLISATFKQFYMKNSDRNYLELLRKTKSSGCVEFDSSNMIIIGVLCYY